MLNFIIYILAIACFITCVLFTLNGFLLFGIVFLGLGILGFCSVLEEELFR